MHEQNEEGPPGGPREEESISSPSERVGSFAFNSTMTREEEKRDLFNAKLDASILDRKTKSVNTTGPVIVTHETYSRIAASLERLQDEEEKPRSSQEHGWLRRYKLVDVDGVKKVARRGSDTLLVAKEYLFNVIQEAHVKVGHGGGRKVMEKELSRSFCNVTPESIDIYLELCEECQQGKQTSKPIAPTKRDMETETGQPPDKMIKKETLQDFKGIPVEANTAKAIEINSETQDIEGSYPPVEDDEYREPEDPPYSPFPNHESEEIIFEDNSIPEAATDTIRLLMKVEKLQAELRYERRCRMLAERELRELKEMNALMAQMRHTAHQLRAAVDQVRLGSDAELPSQSNESISFITESEAENETDTSVSNHILQDDDENYLYLSEGLRVPRILYERIPQITDYKKYVSALLMILFERETLATHSLGGRTNVTQDDSHKPHLPADTMKCIIDHVALKFGATINQIKIAIRTKLSNEDKLLRKRQGKQTDA